MQKFIIKGSNKIKGEITVSGAKNVAMKVVLTGLLTDKKIYVRNVPLITSVSGTADLVKPLGVKVFINNNHSMIVSGDGSGAFTVPLEFGGLYRTATMVIGPLLARFGQAIVPNPGGCRLGKRPVDRHIDGLRKMGAKIKYQDGYFYAQVNKLRGTSYHFPKNTHTGTETLILAAVLAEGETLLENSSEEPEVDDLIKLLNMMGAKVKRNRKREIIIQGVKKLKGAEFSIMPDRNEVVTFAVGALASGGEVMIKGAQTIQLKSFLKEVKLAGGDYQIIDNNTIKFRSPGKLKPTHIVTSPHPGFMTDWQAPWCLLMTQAAGQSSVHETVYEDRFSYVLELEKMGAKIKFYTPKVKNPRHFYNFNWQDRQCDKFQAIRINGKTKLHNALLEVTDLRAGATLVLAAAVAYGESIIHGIEHIDRGYEKIEERLKSLNVNIRRVAN